jgi:hypothetical protein
MLLETARAGETFPGCAITEKGADDAEKKNDVGRKRSR